MHIQKYICDGCQTAVEVPSGEPDADGITPIEGPVGWYMMRGRQTIELQEADILESQTRDRNAHIASIMSTIPHELRGQFLPFMDAVVPPVDVEQDPNERIHAISFHVDVCADCVTKLPALVQMAMQDQLQKLQKLF